MHFSFRIFDVTAYYFLEECFSECFLANIAFHDVLVFCALFKDNFFKLVFSSIVGMERKMIIGLIIAFLMVSSIFGFVIDFAAQPSVKKLKYNDVKFRLANQQYFATIDGVERAFVFFPGDLEFIQVPANMKSVLDKPVLTVSYDPKSDIAENMGQAQYYFEVQLNGEKTIEKALTNNEGTGLPQKTCADATSEQPVIELRKADKSVVSAEGNCVILSALDAYDLYQQTERLIYVMLGVMT